MRSEPQRTAFAGRERELKAAGIAFVFLGRELGKLRSAGVRTLLDVRLNNVSQLAGFAKKQDLEYFLREIASIGYVHGTSLAPTKDILDDDKMKRITWDEYETEFKRLLSDRRPEEELRPDELDHACLPCSEHEAEYCHRRLVVEHLERNREGMEIVHMSASGAASAP